MNSFENKILTQYVLEYLKANKYLITYKNETTKSIYNTYLIKNKNKLSIIKTNITLTGHVISEVINYSQIKRKICYRAS